jgi:hypothetical protein
VFRNLKEKVYLGFSCWITMEDTLFEECYGIINDWKPPQEFSTEREYKDDLRKFLFKELNKSININVKTEDSRALCDIAVGRSIGIELKFGKSGKISKAKIDRLHGQVAGYTKEYREGIIIVLVGDVNDYSKFDVDEKLEDIRDRINRDNFWENYPLKVINKSAGKIDESEEEQGFCDFGLD